MKIFRKYKIYILFLIIVFNSFSLSANDGNLDLSLIIDVPLKNYVPTVYYKDAVINYDEEILDDNNTPFDITNDGSTENFTIRIEGNEGSDKRLKVVINGAYFRLQSPETINEDSSVFAYPVFVDQSFPNNLNNKNISYFVDVPLGVHNDKDSVLENQFKLVWKGDTRLPFGTYTCSIDIVYTVI